MASIAIRIINAVIVSCQNHRAFSAKIHSRFRISSRVHGMKFRARISLISPHVLFHDARLTLVHTHRSRKQASIGCHAHPYITRATRATYNRPFRAPSTPRSDTVIDPGIDRSIARPSCDKGTESVASVANLDRYPASTNLSFVRVCPLDYYMTALQQY